MFYFLRLILFIINKVFIFLIYNNYQHPNYVLQTYLLDEKMYSNINKQFINKIINKNYKN